MRVAFVTIHTPHTLDTPRTRRLDRVARWLVNAGHDVHVCCTQWWEGDVNSFEKDGVEYHRVISTPSNRSFSLLVPFMLRRLKPDLIHASYTPPGGAVGAAIGRWFRSTPLVVDWYDDQPMRYAHPISRWARSMPTAIVAPSRHVETKLLERGVDEEKITVIPGSIDIDLISNQPAAETPDIVTARYLDDEANVEMMLLALAELRDRDWEAMVIGDGPERKAYEEKAVDLRLEDRVTFTGSLSEAQQIAHYKAAHAFVQTAERCSFATELLLAMACGCVGIVDYQEDSAAHELVEQRDRGFRTTDSEELSEAIIEASELEQLEYDAEFASYDQEVVLDQYLSLYEALTDEA